MATTFEAVQNLIASEIRGYGLASDTGVQDLIKFAIQRAIRTYQHRMFWFNHGVDYALTAAGVDRYPFPQDYLAEVFISLGLQDGTRRWRLEKRVEPDIDEISAGPQGEPKWYSVYANRLRITPVPDQAYVFYLSFIKSFPPPELPTDTSIWFDEALDLITLEAESRLAVVPFRDHDLASNLAQLASQELRRLEERTSNYLATGVIDPWL